MKLDKNGYQSEKSDSFATAVKVLTFIFGLGVVLTIVCIYAITQGCGSGGSGSGEPVYDENGVCVNCGNGDASEPTADGYYPPGDSCNGDTCAAKPDYIAPLCKVPTDPEIKKICMPLEAKKARCIFYDYTTDSNPDCDLSKTDHCWCSGWLYDQDDCSSQAQCQKVPCEDWPPEVCQGLPCLLVGKWDCGESSIRDYTDIEFYDNGDGYCRIHELSDPNDDLYYKPGDDHFQRPPSGPFELKYTFIGDGGQLQSKNGDGYSYICTKVVEEE